MPRHNDDEDYVQGLYGKYLVFENDGSWVKNPVSDCFVLRPERDHAALEALRTYAMKTPNLELGHNLMAWIHRIEHLQEPSKEKGTVASP